MAVFDAFTTRYLAENFHVYPSSRVRACWGSRSRSFPSAKAAAHEIVGNRFFPATLGIDDPGVNDELSLPDRRQLQDRRRFRRFGSAIFPPNFPNGSPRISRYRSARPTPSSVRSDPTAAGANGFQNLETTFKYRVFKNPEHEFVMSVGLSVEWGGTGAASVGADPFNTYTPTIYFGKGLGDLPDTLSWIRPVAITGQVGYAIPGRNSTTTFGIDPDSGDPTVDTEFHPRVLNWGGTIQYSMPYLKSAVVDLGLPDFINHLIPLVEANLQTPVANTLTSGTTTTGTINPGVIWVGNTFQVGDRGADSDQPAKRHQCRRDRAAALLPRRHRSARHRQADLRQCGAARQPLCGGIDHATLISVRNDPAAALARHRSSFRPRHCSTMPNRASATRSRRCRAR